MNYKEVQIRPRPRVAIIGDYEEEFLNEIELIFPTVWAARKYEKLEVSPKEVDLYLILEITYNASFDNGHLSYSLFSQKTHVISFNQNISYLPGPQRYVSVENNSDTEEYWVPELELPIYNLLMKDLSKVKNARDFKCIELTNSDDDARKELIKNSILLEPRSKRSFAAIYTRDGKGIAILPHPMFSKIEWIRLLASKWASIDNVFSQYSEENDIKWKTKEETEIANEIKRVNVEREEYNKTIDSKVAELEAKLREQYSKGNQGLRRLIKEQGDELVDEVKKCFESLGFKVVDMDKTLPEGEQRVEDLRLYDPDDSEWIAMAEVKGYGKSAGSTADLQKIQRFIKRFLKENGKDPDRVLYIVNGQFEMAPSQRIPILSSAPKDIETFAEDGGIVFSTLDLFQLIKSITPGTDLKKIREVIKKKTGRLELSEFGL